MSILRNAVLFSIGGGCYTALELAWRRRSHVSMFCLGGACFLAIGQFDRRHPRLHPAAKMAAGSAICTAGELATGLVLNRDYKIWDYRDLPANFLGQVCLPFSLLWMPVTGMAGMLYRWCDKRL